MYSTTFCVYTCSILKTKLLLPLLLLYSSESMRVPPHRTFSISTDHDGLPYSWHVYKSPINSSTYRTHMYSILCNNEAKAFIQSIQQTKSVGHDISQIEEDATDSSTDNSSVHLAEYSLLVNYLMFILNMLLNNKKSSHYHHHSPSSATFSVLLFKSESCLQNTRVDVLHWVSSLGDGPATTTTDCESVVGDNSTQPISYLNLHIQHLLLHHIGLLRSPKPNPCRVIHHVWI